MLRTLFLGAALATTLGYAAQAQPQTSPPSASSQPQASAPPDQAPSDASPGGAAASANPAKPGMVIKDSSGATVGTVVQVGKTADGQAAVVVNIDGKQVSLAANLFTPSGDGLVSSVTKDQIKAAAAKTSG